MVSVRAVVVGPVVVGVVAVGAVIMGVVAVGAVSMGVVAVGAVIMWHCTCRASIIRTNCPRRTNVNARWIRWCT